MRRAVLWDSSAVLALLDQRDANFARAVKCAKRFAEEQRPGFITNHIQVEAHALLLRKLGHFAAREWLLVPAFTVLRATPAEEERGQEIIAIHRDKEWSLCDAISFAVIESRRAAGAFAYDVHFRQYGRFQVFGN